MKMDLCKKYAMPFACATAEAATATITTTTITATTTMSATDKPRPETIRQLFAQRIKTKTKSITGVCLRCAASVPGCPCLSPLALCTALLDMCLSLSVSLSHTLAFSFCVRVCLPPCLRCCPISLFRLKACG